MSQSQSVLKQRASKQREHCELGFRIRREISVPPTRCSSNEIVPVGRSPAPHGFFLCIVTGCVWEGQWRQRVNNNLSSFNKSNQIQTSREAQHIRRVDGQNSGRTQDL